MVKMRKEFSLIFLALFFLSLNAITGAYAVEKNDHDNKRQMQNRFETIINENTDISGDDKADEIDIIGIPYEDGSSYLKELYLEVTGSNGEKYKLN